MATRHGGFLAAYTSSVNPITGAALPVHDSIHARQAAARSQHREQLPFFVPRTSEQPAYQGPMRPLRQSYDESIARPPIAHEVSLYRSAESKQAQLASPVSAEHVRPAKPAPVTSVVRLYAPPPFGTSELVLSETIPVASQHTVAHAARQQRGEPGRAHRHATVSSLQSENEPERQLEAIRRAMEGPAVVTLNDARSARTLRGANGTHSYAQSTSTSRARSHHSRASSRPISPTRDGSLSTAALAAAALRNLVAASSPSGVSLADRPAAGARTGGGFVSEDRYSLHGLQSSSGLQLSHPADFVAADVGLPKHFQKQVRAQVAQVNREQRADGSRTPRFELQSHSHARSGYSSGINSRLTSRDASRAQSRGISRSVSGTTTPLRQTAGSRSGAATPRIINGVPRSGTATPRGAPRDSVSSLLSPSATGADASHARMGRGSWIVNPPDITPDAEGNLPPQVASAGFGASSLASTMVRPASASAAGSRSRTPLGGSATASRAHSRSHSRSQSGTSTPRSRSADLRQHIWKPSGVAVKSNHERPAAGRPTMMLMQLPPSITSSPIVVPQPASAAAATARPSSSGRTSRSASGTVTPVRSAPAQGSSSSSRRASASPSPARSGSSTPRSTASTVRRSDPLTHSTSAVALTTPQSAARAAKVAHLHSQLARLQGELRDIHTNAGSGLVTPARAAPAAANGHSASSSTATLSAAASTVKVGFVSPRLRFPREPVPLGGLHLKGVLASEAIGNSSTSFEPQQKNRGVGGVRRANDSASGVAEHVPRIGDASVVAAPLPPAGVPSALHAGNSLSAAPAPSSSASPAMAATSPAAIAYSIHSPPPPAARVDPTHVTRSSFTDASVTSLAQEREIRQRGRALDVPFVHPDDEAKIAPPAAVSYMHDREFRSSLPLGGSLMYNAREPRIQKGRPILGAGVTPSHAHYQHSTLSPPFQAPEKRKSNAVKLWKV